MSGYPRASGFGLRASVCALARGPAGSRGFRGGGGSGRDAARNLFRDPDHLPASTSSHYNRDNNRCPAGSLGGGGITYSAEGREAVSHPAVWLFAARRDSVCVWGNPGPRPRPPPPPRERGSWAKVPCDGRGRRVGCTHAAPSGDHRPNSPKPGLGRSSHAPRLRLSPEPYPKQSADTRPLHLTSGDSLGISNSRAPHGSCATPEPRLKGFGVPSATPWRRATPSPSQTAIEFKRLKNLCDATDESPTQEDGNLGNHAKADGATD
ncbi:uncharacterized protein [Oryctolagus cuniculus]|uniref:uncharacterized protein n=1 Tax=Oryctolagus cuniculus TaxID=9986 RepID=UPI003878FA13